MSNSEIERLKVEYSTDPNIDYAESLPEKERQAYYMALLGVPNGIAEGVPSTATSPPFESVPLEDREEAFLESFDGGCEGDAYRALPGIYTGRAILTPERHAMTLAIENDPGTRAARESWALCMADVTGTFASQDELENALSVGALEETDLTTVLERATECTIALHERLAPVRIRYENEFVGRYAPSRVTILRVFLDRTTTLQATGWANSCGGDLSVAVRETSNEVRVTVRIAGSRSNCSVEPAVLMC
ncbi:MAG TPA: hypothetical protein ENH00_08110 [Actinobacteria bacterium]|nr:hypothetical protein BMS3Bbin01_02358 [bacterium BMS3Bbin01]HDH26139.1 hypothetical protein [Actinomycetota bacterium]